MVYHENYCRIFEIMDKFWSDEANEDKIQKKIQKSLTKVKYFCYVYCLLLVIPYIIFTAMSVLQLQPFFKGYLLERLDKLFSFGMINTVIHLVFFVNSTGTVLFSAGSDMLFVFIVMHFICELRILKYKYSKIGYSNSASEKNNLIELKRLTVHHTLILR